MLNLRASRGLLSCAAVALCMVFTPSTLHAQTPSGANAELEELAAIRAAANAISNKDAGRFPFLRAFSTSLTTTSQHNSSSGWSSIFYHSLAWRPNQHVSVDVAVPAYVYMEIYDNVGTAAKPVYAFRPQRRAAWGDTVINMEGDLPLKSFNYSGIFSLGLPSGNISNGISAGQVTYSFNNWLEKSVGRFTPNLALGYGDTSSLINQGVLRNYVAVGPMAHFQAGTSMAVTRGISFSAAAYEELPLATDLIFSTTTKGKKKIIITTNEDPGEDNGFLTSLTVPLAPHLIMTGFYNRSLRDHTDIAGFSFTLVGRPSRSE